MSSTIFFCENCNTILDIRKTIKEEIIVKDEKKEKIIIDYKVLLDKVLNNEKLSFDELKMIDLKELVENKYYKNLSGKGEIKKTIIEMIEEMGNTDENINSYFFCNNCNYSKKIDNETKIFSKNQINTIEENEYVDPSYYRNKVFSNTIPITRNFICPNEKCESNTGKKPTEAIFFRKNKYSYKLIHVCKICLEIQY